MLSAVDVVSQEQIVKVVLHELAATEDLARRVPQVEKAHQVGVLPVDVTKDFDGSVYFEQHRLLLDDVLGLFGQLDDLLGAEEKLSVVVEIDVSLGLQEFFDE